MVSAQLSPKHYVFFTFLECVRISKDLKPSVTISDASFALGTGINSRYISNRSFLCV